MRPVSSLAFLGALPLALACDNPSGDACAAAYSQNVASASNFCATYTKTVNTAKTGLPSWASACSTYKHHSSACSCWAPGSTGDAKSGSAPGSSVAPASTTLQTVVKPTSVVINSSVSAPILKASNTSKAKITSSAAARTSAAPPVTSAAGATTAPAAAVTGTGVTSVSVGSAPASCTITAYASLAAAVKGCNNLVISDMSVPASSTLALTALASGGSVTFAGKLSMGTTADSDFDPIVIEGDDIVITGAEGNIIDGNGAAYWDGQGSNGGTDKPDHFIVVKDSTNLVIENLNIQNWPTHCFYISGSQGVVVQNLVLDNSAGDEPNSASGSKPAAHNSDGFDISSSDSVTLSNIKVYNQDDCVAVTSGSNILVDSMYCSGGHGLSIGSIGGKSNNTVAGVTFSNSEIVNSENGCRIKTNADATSGTVSDVTYINIKLTNISGYGIDVQQDYENGGATGSPGSDIKISGVTFENVTGTTTSDGVPYYVLCGNGSCSDFTFTGVSITGGKSSSCNFPSTGCPS